MMNTVDVGKFIATRRKDKSLTQKELAEKLNVTDKAVSKWETGKCYPDIETIEKLAEVLEVGINEILSGKIIEPENQVEEAERNVIDIMKTSKKKQNKWKIITLLACLLAFLIFTLSILLNVNNEVREHQNLTSSSAVFDNEKSMRITIPEIGLKNVLICQAVNGVKLTEDISGAVYLLADNRYAKDSAVADYYLVITLKDKLIAEDLSAWEKQSCLGGTFSCADIDGDGDKEILLHECIGLSGGAGQYLSRVFDLKNGKLQEIFSSHTENEHFDTGFSAEILKENKIEIINTITSYKEIFTLNDRDDNYFMLWYDDKGEPLNREILVDSFYKFEPCDIDSDSVYEIRCCQYISLIGHSDFIGTAVTILEFDKEKNDFVVSETYFEPEKKL